MASGEPVLDIRGLRKTFHLRGSSVAALADVDLTVEPGTFFVLLGPSGCGKTTMLRAIAGLERPDSGTIRIAGTPVLDAAARVWVPPDRRPIAMVFQSYAVWPHMNVFENVAFPLREGIRRLPAAEIGPRVAEVLELLALADMADRPVTTLSGGQQQRVALARALALRPQVLLMDEPLSNLDYKLQVRLRVQLKELMHRLRLTTIYVTHNQGEAMEVGDRIAVMDHGRIIRAGTPRDIYRDPQDEFVARFIGEMTLVPAALRGRSGELVVVDSAVGRMRARAPTNGAVGAGGECLLGIRPEDLTLLADGTPADANIIEGEIAAARYIGEATVYTLRAGTVDLQFKTHPSVALDVGARARIGAMPEHCALVARAADAASLYGEEDLADLGGGAHAR